MGPAVHRGGRGWVQQFIEEVGRGWVQQFIEGGEDGSSSS